ERQHGGDEHDREHRPDHLGQPVRTSDCAEVGKHVHEPAPIWQPPCRGALLSVATAPCCASHSTASTGGCPCPPGRISICRCAPVERPEEPTSPMCCPAVTVSPAVT